MTYYFEKQKYLDIIGEEVDICGKLKTVEYWDLSASEKIALLSLLCNQVTFTNSFRLFFFKKKSISKSIFFLNKRTNDSKYGDLCWNFKRKFG